MGSILDLFLISINMRKNKSKKKYGLLVMVIFCLIGYFIFILISNLNKRSYEIAVFDIEKKLDRNALKYYNFDEVLNYKVDDLITIEYDKDKNNIINVRYNVNNTNTFLNNNMSQIENVLLLNKTNNWFDDKNYIVIMMPVGMAFNNLYFEGFGPKIPFRIYYLESYYVNLSTKVTNYGINNSLVELYIILTIKYQIIKNKSSIIKKQYDYLLSATLINGKVPSIYENGIIKDSNSIELK